MAILPPTPIDDFSILSHGMKWKKNPREKRTQNLDAKKIIILEKMTISALGELIRTKKRDEISKIVSFLSGNIQNYQGTLDGGAIPVRWGKKIFSKDSYSFERKKISKKESVAKIFFRPHE